MEHEQLTFPDFSGVRVVQSLVLCVVYCRSLFFLSSYFFWLWHCLAFLDWQLMITPMVFPKRFIDTPSFVKLHIVTYLMRWIHDSKEVYWHTFRLQFNVFFFFLAYCINKYPGLIINLYVFMSFIYEFLPLPRAKWYRI